MQKCIQRSEKLEANANQLMCARSSYTRERRNKQKKGKTEETSRPWIDWMDGKRQSLEQATAQI